LENNKKDEKKNEEHKNSGDGFVTEILNLGSEKGVVI
jgi:hypothetical protein